MISRGDKIFILMLKSHQLKNDKERLEARLQFDEEDEEFSEYASDKIEEIEQQIQIIEQKIEKLTEGIKEEVLQQELEEAHQHRQLSAKSIIDEWKDKIKDRENGRNNNSGIMELNLSDDE